MRLFEFAPTDPMTGMPLPQAADQDKETPPTTDLQIKLIGLLKQFQGRIKDSGAKKPIKLNAILRLFRENGMSISAEDFREMATEEPVSNIITNVKGDDVFFKGQTEEPDEIEPDQAEKTLDRMSKKAAKKTEL